MRLLLFLALGLLLIARLYFLLAERWGIIDRPNKRSSHSQPTIRGGGILFPLAWLAWSAFAGWTLPYLTLGVMLMGVLGFWDDIRPLPPGVRLLVQILAFTMLWIELMGPGHWSWWFLPLCIVGIGAVNAVNFMDGINGMTGLYALAVLVPLQIRFAPSIGTLTPWSFLIVAILVFGWYNFRKKARCFAGDVGSLSLGYILVFYVVALFLGRDPLQSVLDNTMDYHISAILLLALYGVDSVMTILHRLKIRENIFQAHRRHLYQVLANERGWPHLGVALAYALIQFSITYLTLAMRPSWSGMIVVLLILVLVYMILKVTGPSSLVVKSNR